MNYHPLRVGAIIDETSMARSFLLYPQDKGLFDHRPGQFLTFRIEIRGERLERCYSLSSAPSCDPALKVTVKRVAGGKVSNWFNDTLRLGDIIEATRPAGRFVLRDVRRPLVLFAGGSGITPVISLVRQALYETALAPRLMYANSEREQIIFRDELEELSTRFAGRLQCRHHLDSDSGFMTADTVSRFIEGHTDSDVFICGPVSFMELVEKVAIDMGVTNVYVERFSVDQDPSVAEEQAVEVKMFRATLDGTVHEVRYWQNLTLLDCMLEAGLDPSYSCRDAHCGSCMVVRRSGKVRMRKATVLSRRDLNKGYVLLCQAVPISDDVWVDCDG